MCVYRVTHREEKGTRRIEEFLLQDIAWKVEKKGGRLKASLAAIKYSERN